MEDSENSNVENEVNKGDYSARSLLKSASISASKCIGGKGTRSTEVIYVAKYLMFSFGQFIFYFMKNKKNKRHNFLNFVSEVLI